MDCREWMERISAYVDGEIPSGETRPVEEHLEGCAACRTLERRMRALTSGLARTDTDVSVGMRETLFARMESEGLLRKRRSLFVYSLRWAAIPAIAAAGIALFLIAPSHRGGTPRVPETQGPKVAQTPRAERAPVGNGELTSEEREIIAHLDILEDPASIEEPGEIDDLEIFAPADGGKG